MKCKHKLLMMLIEGSSGNLWKVSNSLRQDSQPREIEALAVGGSREYNGGVVVVEFHACTSVMAMFTRAANKVPLPPAALPLS